MALICVPQYAEMNAREALNQRNQFDDPPGTSTGVNRARQLISESRIRESTAEEIRNFLARHHAQLEPTEDRRLVAIKLWGGQRNQRFKEYLERKLS